MTLFVMTNKLALYLTAVCDVYCFAVYIYVKLVCEARTAESDDGKMVRLELAA